jgi:hypothetical protein
MPRVKKGEMSLSEIRNLARQHNKATAIKGIDRITRVKLIGEIERMGYRVDHEKKRIIKRTMTNEQRKAHNKSVSTKGERKPQKRTKKKRLIAGGDAPVMTKERAKAKPPPIKPAVLKQKKKKEDKAKARREFLK